MSIISTDILIKLSIKTGAAGNSQAQGDPDESLGKYISTTEWAGGTLHDLFDVVTGAENAASDVEHRCIFVHNNHGTLTWIGVGVYIQSQVAGGAAAAIAVDSTAASVIGESNPQALEIADEEDSGTVLSGLSFSAPTTAETALSIGDLAPGECRAVWVRRTAADSAALDADGATLAFVGDTAE